MAEAAPDRSTSDDAGHTADDGVLAAGALAALAGLILAGMAALAVKDRPEVALAWLQPLVTALESAGDAAAALFGYNPLATTVVLAAAAATAARLRAPRAAALLAAAAAIAAGRGGLPLLAWPGLAVAFVLTYRAGPAPAAPGGPSRLVRTLRLALAVATALLLRVERLDVLPSRLNDEPLFGIAALHWLRGEKPDWIGLYPAAFFDGWWPNVGLDAVAFAFLGPGMLQARLVSVALGLVTLLAIYGAGRSLASERVGFWAAMVYAVSPIPIAVDRLGMPYALSVAHAALLLWLVARTGVWTRLRGAICGMLLGLTVALYQASLVTFGLVPLSIALLHPAAARRVSTWVWLALPLAAVVVLQVWLLPAAFRERFGYTLAVAKHEGVVAYAVFPEAPDASTVARAGEIAGRHGFVATATSHRFAGQFVHLLIGSRAQLRALLAERTDASWHFESAAGWSTVRLARALIDRMLWMGGMPEDGALPNDRPLVPPVWSPFVLLGLAAVRARGDLVVVLWAFAGLLPAVYGASIMARRALLINPGIDLLAAAGVCALGWPRSQAGRSLATAAAVAGLALAAGLGLRVALLSPQYAERIEASEELLVAKCLNGMRVWPAVPVVVLSEPRASRDSAVRLAVEDHRPATTRLHVLGLDELARLESMAKWRPVAFAARGSLAAAALRRIGVKRGEAARLTDDGCLLRLELAPPGKGGGARTHSP